MATANTLGDGEWVPGYSDGTLSLLCSAMSHLATLSSDSFRWPVLFVSHGSPMFALEPGVSGPALRAWAQSLPLPRAIVVMSPHWMASDLRVMTHPRPPTWHDFGGFPAPLYQLQYPAPGQPDLARQMVALLQAQGLSAREDNTRPLDHGAWVPLMHLYPEAQVPVVQLALPQRYTPESLWVIGQALAPLREQGVLIIGSGSMTHNLYEVLGQGLRDPAEGRAYAERFCRWVETALSSGNTQNLLDYRRQAPQAERAHPTDEHFATLFFAMGAAGADARPQYLTREIMLHALAMDSLVLQ